MKKILQEIVWDEKEILRNGIFPTGIIKSKFETLVDIDGQTKICYCEIESIVFYPELKYSLQ